MLSKQPQIVRFCQDIIREYTVYPSFFSMDDIANRCSFSLRDSFGESRLGCHDKQVGVVLLKNSFFLNCTLSFQSLPRGKKGLESISLQFFDSEHLLFRTEWHSNDLGKHPQPHWHFDLEQEEESSAPSSFNDYVNQKTSAELFLMSSGTKRFDLSRRHFYMSFSNGMIRPLDFSNDDKLLKDWLTETLRSIDSELRFR